MTKRAYQLKDKRIPSRWMAGVLSQAPGSLSGGPFRDRQAVKAFRRAAGERARSQ